MKLSHEDRILWGRVASTATPLKGRAPPLVPVATLDAEPEAFGAAAAAAVPEVKSQPRPPEPQAIDRPTKQKLAKGRLSLEARVDLHGLTQGEAHELLLSFLHRAFAEGMRHVLVITGKGAGGDGVLKRAVPAWFATASFRGIVGGHDPAARKHGGDGALYVRLRKRINP